jgi:lipopolysaccharide transport system ATP-binding protein
MSELAIDLKDVAFSFPQGRALWRAGFAALRSVSCTINHGDRVGIIGRNGAGKSTLLQIIADVLAPDRGTIVRNHGSCQLLNLNLGFLPHLSGRENAIMSGLLQGFERAEISTRMDAVKEFSELGDFFDQPYRTYSSGMKARLGFSAALQFEPDILLIDEILGVGDAGFQEKSKRALRERIHSGVTVVLVSHSEDLVRSLCTHAMWIEHGETQLYGEVGEVLKAYEGAHGGAESLPKPTSATRG